MASKELIELRRKNATTHGMRWHRAYYVWQTMRQRCGNPRAPGWKNYGGRGIKVCPEWVTFEQFWSDMAWGYFPGLTLERKDNDGDYSPANCVWATRLDQARNTRKTRMVCTPWGVMTFSDAARRAGLSVGTLHYRLKHGKSLAAIFSPPSFATDLCERDR